MKRGFPRPMTYVGKTYSNPRKRNGKAVKSYGKKWDGKKYPHPYTAQEYNIGAIHRGRLKESIKFKRCGACGEPVEDELVGLILWNPRSKANTQHKDWLHSESGPYHFKCLVLTMTRCPHIANTKRFLAACGNWSDVKAQILEYATP